MKNPTQLKKIIIGHLREVKGNLFFAIVCMLGFTVAELLAPWPLKFIFDYVLLEESTSSLPPFIQHIIETEKTSAVIILSLLIFVIALSRGVFSYFQIFFTSRIGFQLVYKLRRELFAHLQRLSLSFHDHAKSGELLTKITGDTKMLRNAFTESILTFVSQIMTLGGMLIVMAFLNWKLTLISMATFPILVYSFFSLYKKLRKSVKKQRKREGEIASKINELLPSISLVQSFSREQYEADLFEIGSARTLKQSIRVARETAATSRMVEIIRAVSVSTTVLFGALQALKGAMTPGDVFIFATYIRNMYSPLQKLAKVSTQFSKAMVSAERISGLLETEPEIFDRPNAIKVKHLRGDICFKEVCFGYERGDRIFNKLSFSITSGQRVALVGSSGAGKSTIAKLILRLYDIQGGEILIDGIDIRNYERKSLREQIGIVDQASVLFGTSIQENILYGKPDASHEEVVEAAQLAHAHEFILEQPEGYATVIGERGSTLSGGQRQRIGLARAIIKKPSLLILDEPTSAVDAESATLIHEAMNRFQAGKTSLVIIHQFNAIQNFDQIIALKNGQVVEKGTHQELLDRKGYYQELYRHQHLGSSD